MLRLACVITAMGASGCATSFMGSAYVEGPKECRSICSGWGMEMSGMVAMGEYSTACVCEVPGGDTRRQAILQSGISAVAGAAGVMMQSQRARERRSRGP